MEGKGCLRCSMEEKYKNISGCIFCSQRKERIEEECLNRINQGNMTFPSSCDNFFEKQKVGTEDTMYEWFYIIGMFSLTLLTFAINSSLLAKLVQHDRALRKMNCMITPVAAMNYYDPYTSFIGIDKSLQNSKLPGYLDLVSTHQPIAHYGFNLSLTA